MAEGSGARWHIGSACALLGWSEGSWRVFGHERRGPGPFLTRKETHMLQLALLFLVIALIAGAVGLFGIASISSQIAWILFVVFLVLFIVSAIAGALRGRPPV